MHPDDRSKFAYMLLRLSTAFDKKVSQVKADMYWEQLLDVPVELVGQAVERWIREGRHYPKVAELRLMCDVVVASSANRKRLAGPTPPTRDEAGNAIYLYHCLQCEDTGWRWHDVDGTVISSLKACEINARMVSPCPCRATNPEYHARIARNDPAPKRYGTDNNRRY